MKKILVFSDCHHSIQNIKRAYSMHKDADLMIFAGDGSDLFENFCKGEKIQYFSVNGNCDGNYSSDYEKVFEYCGIKFYLTHGHYLGGDLYYSLEEKALESSADIAICGHTHQVFNHCIASYDLPCREKNLYLLNPGSISLPRDIQHSPSYAIINLVNTTPIIGIGRL